MVDESTKLSVKRQLIRDEGWRNHLYQDTKGIWTIGVGHNIEERGVSDHVVRIMLEEDMASAWNEASRLPGWDKCNDVRKGVLMQMVFQMGLASVLGFRRMFQAIKQEDWERAADEMLRSKWYRQDTPQRALRHAQTMRRGAH